MRAFLILSLSLFLLAAPSLSHAAEDNAVTKAVDKATETVKENPGKSAGVAGCAAILVFPPAALWCVATIAVGATYDGDTQKLIDKVTK